MLIGSMNYSNSMGFMFTFLIGATALVSVLHSYRNLSQLHLRALNPKPVFAGDTAEFPIVIDNRSSSERFALSLNYNNIVCVNNDIASNTHITVKLPLATSKRGEFIVGKCELNSRFPLGLVTARTFINHKTPCLVYPAPSGNRPLPEPTSSSSGEHATHGEGADDFLGFRQYQPGDSARHIYWKVAAHSNDLLVKQFASQGPAEVWLDWDLLRDLTIEARLSQLCKWVLEAESSGIQYGLKLPDVEPIPPANGPVHQHTCLSQLARFQLPGKQ
jgi:uncharacterized protein (DUF58 family)